MTLAYVLEESIGAQQRTQAALKQMNIHQTPQIFMQFLTDIKALYETQKAQIKSTLTKYRAKLKMAQSDPAPKKSMKQVLEQRNGLPNNKPLFTSMLVIDDKQ